jgi:hypothetical protein
LKIKIDEEGAEMRRRTLKVAVAGIGALSIFAMSETSFARELGLGPQYPAGFTIGVPVGASQPDGIYMTNRINTYGADIVGSSGNATGNTAAITADVPQIAWYPGWTLLGGK